MSLLARVTPRVVVAGAGFAERSHRSAYGLWRGRHGVPPRGPAWRRRTGGRGARGRRTLWTGLGFRRRFRDQRVCALARGRLPGTPLDRRGMVEAVGIESAPPLSTVFGLIPGFYRALSPDGHLARLRLPRCSRWSRAFWLVLLDGCWMDPLRQAGPPAGSPPPVLNIPARSRPLPISPGPPGHAP
jgi:hypothetical protein